MAKSPTKATAVTGTETRAAMPARTGTSDSRFGSTCCRPRKTSQPVPTATMEKSVMLVPRAVMPPSAKSSPWTSSTTARQSAAV